MPTDSLDPNPSLRPWGPPAPPVGVLTPSGLGLLLRLWARFALGSEEIAGNKMVSPGTPGQPEGPMGHCVGLGLGT